MLSRASVLAGLCLAVVAIPLPGLAPAAYAVPDSPALAPAFGGGPVKGCAKFRLDLDLASGLEVDATLRARCFDGRRIVLRWTTTYTDEFGSAVRVTGSGRLLGQPVSFTGYRDLDSSGLRGGSVAVTVAGGPTVAGEDGDGSPSVYGGSFVSTNVGSVDYGLTETAYLSVGSTNYNCVPSASTRGGVSIATMSFGGTHYHGTPSARDRRGLPWALCVTALQVTNDYNRLRSWPPRD